MPALVCASFKSLYHMLIIFSFPNLQATDKYKKIAPEDEVEKRYLSSNFKVKPLQLYDDDDGYHNTR